MGKGKGNPLGIEGFFQPSPILASDIPLLNRFCFDSGLDRHFRLGVRQICG